MALGRTAVLGASSDTKLVLAVLDSSMVMKTDDADCAGDGNGDSGGAGDG